MAILAVAELVGVAVGFVFQEAHLIVADGVDEVVEVLVCESQEHGGGEQFQIFDDLYVQLWGELRERGHGYLAVLAEGWSWGGGDGVDIVSGVCDREFLLMTLLLCVGPVHIKG